MEKINAVKSGSRRQAVRMLVYLGLAQVLCFGILPLLVGLTRGDAILEALRGREALARFTADGLFESIWPLVGGIGIMGGVPGLACLACAVGIRGKSRLGPYLGLAIAGTQLLVLVMLVSLWVMGGGLGTPVRVTGTVLLLGSPIFLLVATIKALWMMMRENKR